MQSAGGRLRVGVQLIDGLQGVQVTSERWERALGDVLALQDDIVHLIVGSIEPALARAERQRAQRKSAPQLDAWESFQRGRWLLFGFRSDDDMLESVRLFQRARDLDPAFASAAALESIARIVLITYLWKDGPEVGGEALRLAELSLTLAEDDPWGQTALGYACGLSGDHAREIAAFERALELNPSLTMAYDGLAGALGVAHPDEAVRIAEKTIRLSPLAASYGYLDRKDEALAALEKMQRMAPQFTVERFRRANSAVLVARCLEGWRRAGWTER